MKQLLNGTTMNYTYSGGLRFIVSFKEGLASYQAVGDTGGVSN